MAVLARLNNQPAASGPEGGPVRADRAAGRRPLRAVVDTGPAGPVVATRSVPVSRVPVWSPSLVVDRVQVGCLPIWRWCRPVHLMVAATVVLAVIGALGWLDHGRSAPIPGETAVVRVGAGETLWDVAQRVAPESDPRAVVERIRQLNRIEGSAVQPGQQLWVPDGR